MTKKIEKTLELNITHEIISLADSFWWYLQPVSLKRYWRPHWRFPIIQPPKSFATGLHINLEGKKGGGYDVCINSPSNFQNGKPRLLFMQFKAGVEKPYNSNRKSLFYGDSTTPNVHVEFDINSNTKRDQHRLLQDLAKTVGNKDAVVYVFPRIVNQKQLIDNVGNLINKTSFISIGELDALAAIHKVKIDDGHPHKFRTCYYNENKNEVNRFFFYFEKQNDPGGIIGEIFSIRMFRAIKELGDKQIDGYKLSSYHIMDAMIRHIFNIGVYFSISQTDLENRLKQYPFLMERITYIDEFGDMPKAYPVNETKSDYQLSIFSSIISAFSIYFKWVNTDRNIDFSELPLPPQNYTSEMSDGDIRIDLNEFGNQGKYEKKDIESITYSLF